MTGYYGFIQSIIRRGWNAYQVTLGIYPEIESEPGSEDEKRQQRGNLLLYRADITIEDNRTILFPDRELSKCIDAYYSSEDADLAAEGLEKQKTVGRIAAAICRDLSDQLLDRRMARAI